jgi:ATP-dependent DNA helicase RecQ
MIEYADSESHCRSVFLLNYFGEEPDRCGICDVCRERNELDLSKYEFDLILEEIKIVLEKNAPDAEELVKLIDYPEERVIKVIRWLLDHNKILPDKDRKLKWCE